jgi:hypothetical protein
MSRAGFIDAMWVLDLIARKAIFFLGNFLTSAWDIPKRLGDFTTGVGDVTLERRGFPIFLWDVPTRLWEVPTRLWERQKQAFYLNNCHF